MNNIFNIFNGYKHIIKNIDNYDDFISIRKFILPFSKNKIEKELIMSIPFENYKSMNNNLFFDNINNILNKNNIKKNYKNINSLTTDPIQLEILDYIINKINKDCDNKK